MNITQEEIQQLCEGLEDEQPPPPIEFTWNLDHQEYVKELEIIYQRERVIDFLKWAESGPHSNVAIKDDPVFCKLLNHCCVLVNHIQYSLDDQPRNLPLEFFALRLQKVASPGSHRILSANKEEFTHCGFGKLRDPTKAGVWNFPLLTFTGSGPSPGIPEFARGYFCGGFRVRNDTRMTFLARTLQTCIDFCSNTIPSERQCKKRKTTATSRIAICRMVLDDIMRVILAIGKQRVSVILRRFPFHQEHQVFEPIGAEGSTGGCSYCGLRLEHFENLIHRNETISELQELTDTTAAETNSSRYVDRVFCSSECVDTFSYFNGLVFSEVVRNAQIVPPKCIPYCK